MRQLERDEDPDLRHLQRTLDGVVAALGATGASSFRDLYLTVSGVHLGERRGELAVVGGEVWLREVSERGLPLANASPEDVLAERALLLACLCHLMWHWQLSPPEVSRFLDCPVGLVEDCIATAESGAVPVLQDYAVDRIRRLILVDNLRELAGVSNDDVKDWLREPRPELGGEAVLPFLLARGEPACRRIVVWLLGRLAAGSATVH